MTELCLIMPSTDFSTIRQAILWGEQTLRMEHLECPIVEVRALLSEFLNCSPTQLYLNLDEPLSPDVIALFRSAISRRARREPVAYIVGRKNFLGREFLVTPDVLIPRPETELLVDMVVQLMRMKNLERPSILDVCTGSGCVAVSLNLEIKSSQIYASDISVDALRIAQQNAQVLRAPDIRFFESDLTKNLPPEKMGDFDIIVSNPPYVSSSELLVLAPDLGYEPRLAFNGGRTGLDVIRPLIAQARLWLKQKGQLVLEIGYQQGNSVKKIFESAGYQNVLVLKDYQGHDRLVKGEWCGSV